MNTQSSKTTELELQRSLAKEVRVLTREVKKLKELEFMKFFNHPLKMIGYSFVKGVMVGFGSVLGATVLVAIFIFFLSKISFVPIIGEFVQEVIHQIQPGNSQNGSLRDSDY